MSTSTTTMPSLAIIGLGYVGLPLAIEFAKHRPVIGYDISATRIKELQAGRDHTLEVSPEDFENAKLISFTNDPQKLCDATVFIVTVPTPVDKHKNPNFSPLISASELVGGCLKKNDIVVYESTVFPGATEEICVPTLESASGLKYNRDFYCGYSPERINPGDKTHQLTSICKVTSGSTPETAEIVDQLYKSIITAGTHKAESIKVAEAAKVIENTQRDLNIALINELAIIFNRVGVDTSNVLAAANTKWNFLPFRPGLVGGHCIGVDPYYLTYKAEELGYHPQVILAGRRINDGMGSYVASEMIKGMLRKGIGVSSSKLLVMGFTFKEDCPDIRNTRVIDVIDELKEYGVEVDVYDPWVDPRRALEEYGLSMIDEPEQNSYDGVIVAVAHREFVEKGHEYVDGFLRNEGIIYDLKHIFPLNEITLRL